MCSVALHGRSMAVRSSSLHRSCQHPQPLVPSTLGNVRPISIPSFQTTVADIFKKYPEIEQECNDEVANHEWCTNIK